VVDFAAWSSASLPRMPQYPGTQQKDIFRGEEAMEEKRETRIILCTYLDELKIQKFLLPACIKAPYQQLVVSL